MAGRGPGGRGGHGGAPQIFRPSYAAVKDEGAIRSEDTALNSLKKKTDFVRNELPTRPAYGDRGNPVLLWANCFLFKANADIVVYRYTVSITAAGSTRTPTGKLAGRLLQLLIEHLSAGRHDIVSDGRNTLISRTALSLASPYTIPYRAEGQTVPEPNATNYVYTVEHNAALNMSEVLINHAASPNVSGLFKNQEEMIQALNLVVGQHPKTQTTVFAAGKNRYVGATIQAEDQRSLGAGLEALRAFVFSVRTATQRMLINVQIKNLPFYEEGSLVQLSNKFTSANGTNPRNLANFLRRLSVSVSHLAKKSSTGRIIPRYKTIIGFAAPGDGRTLPNPPRIRAYGAGSKQVEFFLQDAQASSSTPSGAGNAASTPKGKGKKATAGPSAGPSTAGRYISVYDFFRTHHDIIDATPHLPVVNVGTVENPAYLPMQACIVRRGQLANGKISPAQTAAMITFAVRKPDQNLRSITTSGRQILGLEGNNVYLNAFGMSVGSHLITVPGRVLQSPELNYGGQKSKVNFGSWNLDKRRFYNTKTIRSWTYLYVYLATEIPMSWDTFDRQADSFTASMRSVGITVPERLKGLEAAIQPGDPQGLIKAQLAKFANSSAPPDLILVVVPQSDSTAVYNLVKHHCDVDFGLRNICVLDKKISGWQPNLQYWANVCLKVNLKMGGINHIVNPADLGTGISTKDTMFVGIDVTHPSPGSASTAPSIAGIVSSVDEYLGQWPADIRIQEARKEMVGPLQEMMSGCLRRWQETGNKPLPNNIIVYRDGVSEGQYQEVINVELKAIRDACNAVYPVPDQKNGKPKISIVIVGKRHHTRFYATNTNSADRSGNPHPGTVVDRGVTDAANWDFFLQAHAAIKGTARPAHYYVIYDEIFRKRAPQPPLPNAANSLEQLSHSLCYLFGRATKAVSVCPPAYYADLVCERARCYLSRHFSPQATPVGSVVAPNVAGAAPAQNLPNPNSVKVHDRVNETMFYI